MDIDSPKDNGAEARSMATSVHPIAGYPSYGSPPGQYNGQQGGQAGMPPNGDYTAGYNYPPNGAPPTGYPMQQQQQQQQQQYPGTAYPPGGAYPTYNGQPMPAQAYPAYNGAPQGMMPPPGYQGYAPPPGAVPMGGYAAYPVYNGAPGGNPGDAAYAAYGNPSMAISMVNHPAYPAHPGMPPIGAHTGIPNAPRQDENPANRVETGRWTTGVCNCCDHCIPNFFMPWCCPCVSLAQVYARLGLSTYRVALIRFGFIVAVAVIFRVVTNQMSSSFNNSMPSGEFYDEYKSSADVTTGLVSYGVFLLQAIVFTWMIFSARRHIRHRFRIPGSACTDLLLSWCCPCCTIAQMATHVKSYNPGSCDFTGPDMLPPYL